ncbi:MAG: hypothetical protein K5757_02210 [Bacteroidaceae bacterium]|jgi:hypothetical protein|nr:hypothetical protein [Bacteroidaceae bacterium]
MKLIVMTEFRDKVDHVTVYGPDTVLEVKDKERAADLIERGLCAEYKGRKSASVTLGGDESKEEEDEPKADVTEKSETEAETEENDSEEKDE